MEQYISKATVVAEIKKIYNEDYKFLPSDLVEGVRDFKDDLLMKLNALEVKEVQEEPVSNPTPNEKMSVERWEEACKAACCDRNYRSHYGLTETRDDYFVDGVQWADEHPKEETISEDLEEEIQKTIHNHFFDLNGIAIAGTSVYATVDDMVYIAKHFANWQKEQMIKDAIDAEASYTMSVPCITISLPLSVNVGDKVKVIIIKSE